MHSNYIIQATVNANYEFTVRFYEFNNPQRLQCGECLNGGQPACCDIPGHNFSCSNNCETRFRFMLRSYEAPVDIAPTQNTDFPYITPGSSGKQHDVFMTGSRAFLGLSNPFHLTSTDRWNVSISTVSKIAQHCSKSAS